MSELSVILLKNTQAWDSPIPAESETLGIAIVSLIVKSSVGIMIYKIESNLNVRSMKVA